MKEDAQLALLEGLIRLSREFDSPNKSVWTFTEEGQFILKLGKWLIERSPEEQAHFFRAIGVCLISYGLNAKVNDENGNVITAASSAVGLVKLIEKYCSSIGGSAVDLFTGPTKEPQVSGKEIEEFISELKSLTDSSILN